MYRHFVSVVMLQSSVLNVLYQQVLRNKPDFRRKPWPTISNSAKDFVRKLLVKDPRARLTAAQALCMCIIIAWKEKIDIIMHYKLLMKKTKKQKKMAYYKLKH